MRLSDRRRHRRPGYGEDSGRFARVAAARCRLLGMNCRNRAPTPDAQPHDKFEIFAGRCRPPPPAPSRVPSPCGIRAGTPNLTDCGPPMRGLGSTIHTAETAMPFDHDARTSGIALALSGGGFRAVLFHVGVLWRPQRVRRAGQAGADLQRVRRLHRLGVAGRALASARVRQGRLLRASSRPRSPRRCASSCAQHDIDVASVLSGAFNPVRSGRQLAVDEYRKRLGSSTSRCSRCRTNRASSSTPPTT